MATKNEITGDTLISKQTNEKFSKGYDAIDFSKKLVLCDICGKDLGSTKECAWTSCPLYWNEARVDIVGQNGNIGYGSN